MAHPELEMLVCGKKDYLQFPDPSISRESLLNELNSVLLSLFPGSWVKGEFLNRENSSYLVYELHLQGETAHNLSFRFIEFCDRFMLVRV